MIASARNLMHTNGGMTGEEWQHTVSLDELFPLISNRWSSLFIKEAACSYGSSLRLDP